MKITKIVSITLICSCLFVFGCAGGSTKTAESTQPDKKATDTAQTSSASVQSPQNVPQFFQTDIREDLSGSIDKSVAAALSAGDTQQMLVGTWRHSWGPTAPNCGSEHILMADGNYSGMGGCAGFVPLRTVGKWFLMENGTIRIAYSDWEPKTDQAGNPVRIPSGETWRFKFLDRNRMALGDGAIIAYRIQ